MINLVKLWRKRGKKEKHILAMPIFSLTIDCYHCFGSSSWYNKTRKLNDRNRFGKAEIKLSFFTNDIIIYVENPKESVKQLLKLVSVYSKGEGHKVNTKSQTLSYIPAIKKWYL